MSEFFLFLVLGLGLGAAYSLMAQGLVVINRGAGVINFANGAFGLVGAYSCWELERAGLPAAASVLIGLAAAAALGAATHLFAMKRLWSAAQLTRVVVTLGLLTLINGLFVLHYQQSELIPAPLLPNSAVHVGGVTFSSYDLYLLGIAALVSGALFYVYRFTRFGLLTSASAENRRAFSALGHSADMVATANWGIGAVLAAFAAILIAPITSLSVVSIGLLLVPALGAALLGNFSSFGLAFLGGIIVGVGESFMQWANVGPGWPDAVPFIVVIVVLLFKGTSLPDRSMVQLRLPRVGTGRVNWSFASAAVVISVVLSLFVSGNALTAMTGSAAAAIIMLSSVVVTGYAGQLSLAQLGLAGIGAFIAARVTQSLGLGFWWALVIGTIGVIPVGIIVGVPALRARGVNLAIVTLGIGVIVEEVVLNNPAYSGGITGTTVATPSIFGFDLDAELYPGRYFWLALALLVAIALGVSNLRRSSVGRRLIAVRGNERAAASLGIHVARVKLYAFALSASIATVGGLLIIYQAPFVSWATGWDVYSGIALLSAVVIFGLGYTSGAIVAASAAAIGLVPYLFSLAGTGVANWIVPISGLGVILAVIKAPDGLMAFVTECRTRKAPSKAKADPVEANSGVPPLNRGAAVERQEGHRLQIEGLSVRFGGIQALDDVSLGVCSGEIVGLIGPNGAGKTTLIDIVTGMTKSQQGDVILDGKRINGLGPTARALCGMARSFQSLELFDDLTIEENVRAASDHLRWWTYLRCLIWPTREPLSPVAQAAIGAFGLTEDLKRRPSDLPYGRRRLVGIARAVAGGAPILLLDEPAAGLDEGESAELARLLRILANEWGIGILLVEHDMTLVMSVSNRIAALDFGRVISIDKPEGIRHDPRVIAAYLGTPDASDPKMAEIPMPGARA